MTPIRSEVTTEEAAGLLDISLPSLLELLDEGAIPFRREDAERRVQLAGLTRYKRVRDADRRLALDELVAYDQELGI